MKHTFQNDLSIRAIDRMSRKYIARMFTNPTVQPSRRDGWLA